MTIIKENIVNSFMIEKETKYSHALLQLRTIYAADFVGPRSLQVLTSLFVTHADLHLRNSHMQSRYRIRPNYRTVRLGFSELLGTLSCGKIWIYLLRVHYKKSE